MLFMCTATLNMLMILSDIFLISRKLPVVGDWQMGSIGRTISLKLRGRVWNVMMGMDWLKMGPNVCHVLILVLLVIRHRQIVAWLRKLLTMLKRTKPTQQPQQQVVKDMWIMWQNNVSKVVTWQILSLKYKTKHFIVSQLLILKSTTSWD